MKNLFAHNETKNRVAFNQTQTYAKENVAHESSTSISMREDFSSNLDHQPKYKITIKNM